jgi:phosphoribosyl 1,2-cyclic phosphodiesterase
MKICSLASGSRGNSIFIESNDTRVLIDAGLSALKIKNSLLELGVEPDTIDAIVITHAHRDHVNGAGVFSRQFNTPIWGHTQTLDYLTFLFQKNQQLHPWKSDFRINNVNFSPFILSHDAIPTVGYKISDNNKKMAVCTDLGVVTHEVEESLKEVDFLVIESNHDPDLLRNGPYPIDLKLRISSDVGHLSNHDTGLLLKKVLH